MTRDEQMLLILSLDPAAKLLFSVITKQWYVSAGIEITNGSLIGSITKHAESPERAIGDYVMAITRVHHLQEEKVVVHSRQEDRREYRWNGVAFTEHGLG